MTDTRKGVHVLTLVFDLYWPWCFQTFFFKENISRYFRRSSWFSIKFLGKNSGFPLGCNSVKLLIFDHFSLHTWAFHQVKYKCNLIFLENLFFFMVLSSTCGLERAFQHKESSPAVANGLEDGSCLFQEQRETDDRVPLSLWGHTSWFWWWTTPKSSLPLSNTDEPSLGGLASLAFGIVGHREAGREFNLQLPCGPVLLWAGEAFLPQIHLVTLIFLWFNLVFIPKVGPRGCSLLTGVRED